MIFVLCIIALIVIATAQRGALVFPVYDKVYYRLLPATDINTVIVFPKDIYRYTITRDGAGPDTVFIHYKNTSGDSTTFAIPPSGGGKISVLFEYGPPLNDEAGVRFMSGASTPIIIEGVYN
jgi:hypothetical protein